MVHSNPHVHGRNAKGSGVHRCIPDRRGTASPRPNMRGMSTQVKHTLRTALPVLILLGCAGITGCTHPDGDDTGSGDRPPLISSSTESTILDLRSVCSDEGTSARTACDDDSCTSPELASSISVSLSPGAYYLWLDGYSESACGAYQINITHP